MSYAADTVLYAFYGNAGVTTSQESKTAVWDSNFVGVWHLGNNSSLSTVDSTSNANGSAATGSGVSGAAAILGTGAALDGSANAYMDMGTSSTLDLSGAFTLSAWFK
ncbi:MAG: hypothetical protein ACR2I2_03265, partial [Bryobacteraceae bacterium]